VIVLDTNVISELVRVQPAQAVVRWVVNQPADELRLTAPTVAELTYGAARLPDGRRRRELEATLVATVDESFMERVLPFDVTSGQLFGPLVASRERLGRPIETIDAQIAAVCLRYGASLATRNTRDFEGLGLTLIDPWTA
jgi:predicted nucleic acid-binding protein